MYHTIGAAWDYSLSEFLGIADISSLPEDLYGVIKDGELQKINPCLVFPWLHFFMPWFFYKSGQFFKKTSTKDLWKKDSQKLLKTFVIWSIAGYLLYILVGCVNHWITLRACTYSTIRELFLRGYIVGNLPLWFLLTLFGVRFVANKILPDREDKYAWIKMATIVLTGYVISYLAYRFNHRLLPYWIANGAAGLSFFALGYAMRELETKWWLIVPCAIVYVLGGIFGFPIVDMWPNDVVAGNYLLWIPVAFCCIVTFNAVCRIISQYIRIKPIEWVGSNAISIYVIHALIITMIVELILSPNHINISSVCIIGLIILAYIVLFPLCVWLKNWI